MIKKALLIVIVVNLISTFQSCCSEDYTYKWTGFRVQMIDNSGIEPTISENKHIPKKALGLRISMLDTVFFIARNFKIINTCYATSCGESYTRLHDLNSIFIITLNDYSDHIPAETNITSLFRARLATDINKEYIPINDIVAEINNGYNHSKQMPDFDLYLMDTSCIGGQQQFEISFILSDGSVFTKQTEIVELY